MIVVDNVLMDPRWEITYTCIPVRCMPSNSPNGPKEILSYSEAWRSSNELCLCSNHRCFPLNLVSCFPEHISPY